MMMTRIKNDEHEEGDIEERNDGDDYADNDDDDDKLQ